MKNILFILFLTFLFACHSPTRENPYENMEIENTEKSNAFKDFTSHPALGKFVNNLKNAITNEDISSIYENIDPLQMGIQTEDMEMDSVQNVIELLDLYSSTYATHSEIFSNIKQWDCKGYKELEKGAYLINGILTFENGKEKEFNFRVNELMDNQFVITGAVG